MHQCGLSEPEREEPDREEPDREDPRDPEVPTEKDHNLAVLYGLGAFTNEGILRNKEIWVAGTYDGIIKRWLDGNR